jgi:predicted ATPase/DNA-binding winged helix-turn-helix (wHTH) protein
MDPGSQGPVGISFGRFRVLPGQREVFADGQPIKLGGRAFDVLMALVEGGGAVVSRKTLMARVWPGQIVDENNLAAQIAALRAALGDDRALIRTVSGRGYQFTGEIRVSSTYKSKAPGEVVTTEQIGVLPPTNVPEPVSELIGRDAELKDALSAAGVHRLLTLTGAGGIGKTTLALALAREQRTHFADGVWLVEFSALADPELVPATVAAAVGLDLRGGEVSARRVAEALAQRRVLLVLDTCEHLIGAVAAMAQAVLQAGAGPRIIATSREPLRAEGEWIIQVPSLSLPDLESGDPYRSGAVLLFALRSQASGALIVQSRHASAIASICRQLDGIPLAIELAAARAAALGVEGLAARLDDCFQLLTGGRRTALPRHQTLRATLDWSYGLLTGEEQLYFRRLAVFAGSFTLEAAANVASGRDPNDYLADLVAKSLVAAEFSDDGPRFRLLDTTRSYALQKLRESGEFDQLARRHAEYYLGIFDRAEREWEARSANVWLDDYGWQINNLRAALDWAFSPNGEVSIGAKLAAAAVPLWMHLALLDECRRWMAATLAAFPAEQLGSRQEMAVQLAFGYSSMITQGLTEKARAALERANELGKRFEDLDYQLRALTCLVVFNRMYCDLSPALALSREVGAIAQKIASPLAMSTADCLLASTLLWVGQYAEARVHAETVTRRNEPEIRRAHLVRHGYDYWMNSRTLLAQILWVQGFSEHSLRLMQGVLIEAERMSHPFTLAYALTTTGCLVSLWTGDLKTARQRISRLKEHAANHALSSYYAAGLGFEGLLDAAEGDRKEGARLIRASLTELHRTGFYLYWTVLLTGLAEILASCGEIDDATVAANDAFELANRGGNHWWLPEALRVKAGVLLVARPEDSDQAENFFGQALDLAHRQGALAWELRAAKGLARVLRDHARPADAAAVLRPVYGRFTEGFDTTDVKEARALLDICESSKLAYR